jgi:hypothetical protein
MIAQQMVYKAQNNPWIYQCDRSSRVRKEMDIGNYLESHLASRISKSCNSQENAI